MSATSPSLRTLLESLPSRARLIELARHFGVFVPQKGTKAELCAALARSEQVRVRAVVEWMGRDELRAACQAHDLDAESRARPQLAGRLLSARPPRWQTSEIIEFACSLILRRWAGAPSR